MNVEGNINDKKPLQNYAGAFYTHIEEPKNSGTGVNKMYLLTLFTTVNTRQN